MINLNKQLLTLIEEEKKFRKAMDRTMDLLGAKSRDDKKILSSFNKLLKQYPCNPTVLVNFFIFVKLTTDEAVVKNVKDEVVCELLEAASNSAILDAELNIEYFFYLFNVMDQEKKAKRLFNKFKTAVEARLNEFNSYVEESDSGKIERFSIARVFQNKKST